MSRITRWLEVSMPADSPDYALWESLGLRNEYVIMTSVPTLDEIAEERDRWEGSHVIWTMNAATLNKALKKFIVLKSSTAQRWANILMMEKQSEVSYGTYSEWSEDEECRFRWEPSPHTRRKEFNLRF